jgi:hypothetical protein
MSASVTVTTSAAIAAGNAPSPTVWVKTGTLAATAAASAPAPTVIIGPSATVFAVITIPAPHPHVLADHHHDPVAYGIELGLTVAVLFVGGKLIAGRTFRL